MVFVQWADLQPGDVFDVVITVLCRDDERRMHVIQAADYSGRRMFYQGDLPPTQQVVFLQLKVTQARPCLMVVSDDATYAAALPPCTVQDMFQVTDLCCGIGAFTSEISSVGFHTKLGIDSNDRWQPLFQELHGQDVQFHHGEASDVSSIRCMLEQGRIHGTVCAGVSCQPYSVLGDGQGMQDPRADSLRQVLKATWLTQSLALVLECVPPVMQNKGFQDEIHAFCARTGYHYTQNILRLGNTWAARRDRWFGVLTAPALGPLHVPDLPTRDDFQTVEAVMPFVRG
eukprot:Skav205931  [mRNA]  locus=scaffold2739:40541:41398:- [translate_table: standard]